MLCPTFSPGVQTELVIRERVTAIQPIKLFGEASTGPVRQPHSSGCSQWAIDQERGDRQETTRSQFLHASTFPILWSNLNGVRSELRKEIRIAL